MRVAQILWENNKHGDKYMRFRIQALAELILTSVNPAYKEQLLDMSHDIDVEDVGWTIGRILPVMDNKDLDLKISTLGEGRIPSPMAQVQFVSDEDDVLYHSKRRQIEALVGQGKKPPTFEMAGPREKIYFDPSKLKCGIVTCGGLCPGLNDVIRAIVMGLFYHYGVKTVFGFRYGYEGLSYRHGHAPMELTPEVVEAIHKKGGTILGSSRGPQEVSEMVDTLERMNLGLLFAIGGDGTLRGARAYLRRLGGGG